MLRSRYGIPLVFSLWALGAHADTPNHTFEIERVPFANPASADVAHNSSPRLATPQVVYQHTNALRIAAAPGAGNIWAEDVHLTSGGNLTRVMIGYYMDVNEEAHGTIWIYSNDEEDTHAPSTLVVQTQDFGLQPSRSGEYIRFVVNFNDPIPVGRNLWIAVSFDHDNPGLVLVQGDAQVGSSHNIYYDLSADETAQLPAPYLANFVAEVRVDLSTDVQALTWSRVKSRFAPAANRPSASQ